MMRATIDKFILFLLALAVCWPVSIVYAQGATLEEVIVTARKRSENLQAIPVSATALTAADLQDAALPDLRSIAEYTPNLNFTIGADGSSSSLQAFIRGVGEVDFAITTDPAVGVYVDGVYLARTIGANLEFADIERIEVLRGPQGTLFGKNTIGGAISVTTRAPTGESRFSVQGTVGRFDYRGFKAYGEFPIIDDTLAGSISVLAKQSDGWQERPGDNSGNDDMVGGRLHLNFTPTDSFSSHFVMDYVDQDQQVYPRVLANFNDQQLFPSFYNNFVAGPGACCESNSNDIDRSNVARGEDELESFGISWTNSWDVGELTIKSITGYRTLETATFRDSDNNAEQDYFSVFTSFDHDQFSQELLVSGETDRMNWVAGVYYFSEDGDHLTDVTLAQGLFEGLSALPPMPPFTLPTGVPLAFLAVPFDLTLSFDRNQEVDSLAAYFHTDWQLAEKLKLTIAGRYTQEEKTLTMFGFKRSSQTPIVLPGPTDPDSCSDVTPQGVGSVYTCNETWNEFSPKIGLSYQWSDEVMTYASVSRGFRSGSFNGRPTATAEISEADPETLTSFEIGVKSDLMDNRLRINAAAFLNEYEDQQFLVNRSSASLAGGLALIVANAAESSLSGFELEFEAVASDAMRVFGSASYIKAEFDDFVTLTPDPADPTGATFITEDASDRPFQNTPEWNAMVGAQYEMPIGSAGTLKLRGDVSYKSDVFFTNDRAAADFELLHPSGYSLVNAGIIFTSSSEQWEVALHGRNLGDKRVVSGGFTVDAFGSTDVAYTQPRQYFLSVKYKME